MIRIENITYPELVHLLHTAVSWEGGPFGLRYPRGAGPGTTVPATQSKT